MKKLVVVALLAACGSAKQQDTLAESIRSYNEGIRWERFAIAAGKVPVTERGDFVADMDERAEEVRITDYELVRVDQNGEKAARVQVKWSWYRDREGTLHQTHAIQEWERQGKEWLVVDTKRLRGDEMPGVPDRGNPEIPDNLEVSESSPAVP